MKRRLLFAAAMALASCERPGICTQIVRADQIKDLPANDPRAVTDCLIVNARRFANASSGEAAISKAVMSACSPQADAIASWARDSAFKVEMRYGADAALQAADVAEKEIRDKIGGAALRFVVEAQSGRCSMRRPITLVTTYPDAING